MVTRPNNCPQPMSHLQKINLLNSSFKIKDICLLHNLLKLQTEESASFIFSLKLTNKKEET